MVDISEEKVTETGSVEVNPEVRTKAAFSPVKLGLIGLGVGLAVAAVTAVVVLTVGIYKFNWSGKTAEMAANVLPYPAATVNGNSIRLADFNDDVFTLQHFYSRASEYGFEDFGGVPPIEEIRANALDRLIRNEILSAEAERRGITVSEDEVNEEFLRLSGGTSSDEMKNQISDLYGWTPEKFKEKVIRPFILEERLVEALSEDESVNGEVMAAAEAVMEEIDGGADFGEMAAKYSEDPSNAEAGGELGWFGRGVMVPEFEDMAFSLKAGEIGGPVRTEFGYHLILVSDVKEGEDGEVEEVEASHILFRTVDVADYLNGLLDEAKIKKYIDVE